MRASVVLDDLHASFMVSAPDSPTAVYCGKRIAGTYISFVDDMLCTVYYHTWGHGWYWRALPVSALESGAISGHVFVFINNDDPQDVTLVV